MNWKYANNTRLSKENLRMLLMNEIPYVRVKEFLDETLIKILLGQFEEVGYDFYESVIPPIGKIGVTVFENQENSLKYFKESKRITNILSSKSMEHQKVMSMISSELQSHLNLEPLTIGDGEYFAGLIRNMRGGALLHSDFAPFDACEYSIGSEVVYQLACNIYLKLPASGGGNLVVYNKPWTPIDESERILRSYGYRDTLVENAESVEVYPEAGELVLFNSQNFHKVVPNHNTDEERITLSCFAGVTKRGKLILWS